MNTQENDNNKEAVSTLGKEGGFKVGLEGGYEMTSGGSEQLAVWTKKAFGYYAINPLTGVVPCSV